jgi:hypothetical protein
MDQMASVGVEFDLSCLERVAQRTIGFYESQKAASKKRGPKWAIDPIYSNNQPVRPWGLGSIHQSSNFIYKLAGFETRTPGLYKRTDPKTDRETNIFLQDTNERIHCSARIRLACKGLGLDDKAVWTCPSLANWQLKYTDKTYKDPIPQNPSWWEGPADGSGLGGQQGGRWVWEYTGPKSSEPTDPKQRIMVEEPLGPYERYLLQLSAGTPNVYLFAETQDIVWQGKTIPAPQRAKK